MSEPLAPVTSPVSLEKLAYESIKGAILSFRLQPGANLVESDLARQLAISKTPVRDALLRLEKEGFISKIPYTGYYVAEISRKSVEDIFQIRAVLEGLAVRLAIPLFQDSDQAKAQQIIQSHREAAEAGDIKTASQLNHQFHELILNRSDNERLLQILANLDDHLQRYRILSNYQTGRLQKSVTEHQRILAAIAQHQADLAEQEVRAHLLSVLSDLEHQDFTELLSQISVNGGAESFVFGLE
jgi:DNA-binding GntR family transcriptional regulator